MKLYDFMPISELIEELEIRDEQILKLEKDKATLIDNQDKQLAICQMYVLQTVYSGGGCDIDTAIKALNLNYVKYLQLAKNESIYFISKVIEEVLK